MKGSLFQECYLCYFNKNVFFITGNFQNNHDSLTSRKYGPLSNVVQQQRNNEHDDFQLKNRIFIIYLLKRNQENQIKTSEGFTWKFC